MLRLIDDQIGLTLDLLRSRNMLEDTLVIFTSDHGDMLGDHYMIQKGVPWRGSCEIPLAMHLPHARPIGTCTAPVELTDVTATILDYAALSPRQALSRSWPAYNDVIPCRSLLPILRGEAERVRDYAFAESDFTEERSGDTTCEQVMEKRGEGRSNAWQMIVTNEDKYIKYLGYTQPGELHEEYYRLDADPNELHNCIDQEQWAAQVKLARERLQFVCDHTPTAQLTWAKVNAHERKINSDRKSVV